MNNLEAIAKTKALLAETEDRIASQRRAILRLEHIDGDETEECALLEKLLVDKTRHERRLAFLQQWLGNSN